MYKKALIAAFMITFLSSCSSKPQTEAERVVAFLRDLSDEQVAHEFNPVYWEKQCRSDTQIWKTAIKICRDGGPHHWMCDVISNMRNCTAQDIPQ